MKLNITISRLHFIFIFNATQKVFRLFTEKKKTKLKIWKNYKQQKEREFYMYIIIIIISIRKLLYITKKIPHDVNIYYYIYLFITEIYLRANFLHTHTYKYILNIIKRCILWHIHRVSVGQKWRWEKSTRAFWTTHILERAVVSRNHAKLPMKSPVSWPGLPWISVTREALPVRWSANPLIQRRCF